jgi:hypothetical protein
LRSRRIDSDGETRRRPFSEQTRRPAGAAAEIKHPRAFKNFHPRDGLLTHWTMPLLHLCAAPGARPFVEFQTQMFFHRSRHAAPGSP